MTPEERGWLAGFLEGEGSFMFSVADVTPGAARRNGRFAISVRAVSTDRDVIARCHLVAGGRIYGPYGGDDRTKPYWRWQTTRQAEAVDLMMRVLPLMGERRSAQIRVCLAAYAAKAAVAPADRTHCPQGHPYTDENVLVLPNGWRQCRRCNTDRARSRRERDRLAA